MSGAGTETGDLDNLFEIDTWHDEWLATGSTTVSETEIVSIGGGMGSLALVDLLRQSGMGTDSIRVVSPLARPYDTYSYLARNSQIPDHERLRSDAGSVIDNVWGFPSYAFREAAEARTIGGRVRPLWTVLSEPVLTEYFTPKAAQVYRSVERECARIGWSDMLVPGQARAIRRRADGGYFVVVNPEDRQSRNQARHVIRAEHVHLSVGYPGLRFLPDLQEYRETHHDPVHVVNAYENHDHVYAALRDRPGVVVLRGGGVVASRVLQRLFDDNEQEGASTTVVHLFRNYVDGPQESTIGRRPGGGGLAYQAFNYPKASWGGQLRDTLLHLDPEQRPDFIGVIGGTNTAPRRAWRRQLERAEAAGHYRQVTGRVAVVNRGEHGLVIELDREDGSRESLDADYVIDATGLLADVRESRLIADLLDHGGASTNPFGRLDVTPSFEVRGTASAGGRLYASGSITLGGPYAPVDSFLGLQYAAMAMADDLAGRGVVERFGSRRSVRQWWRWARGRTP